MCDPVGMCWRLERRINAVLESNNSKSFHQSVCKRLLCCHRHVHHEPEMCGIVSGQECRAKKPCNMKSSSQYAVLPSLTVAMVIEFRIKVVLL